MQLLGDSHGDMLVGRATMTLQLLLEMRNETLTRWQNDLTLATFANFGHGGVLHFLTTLVSLLGL